MDICGEIIYGDIHSDICVGHGMVSCEISQETKDFLVANLLEWLNDSNGDGFFWVGNPEQIQENFTGPGSK